MAVELRVQIDDQDFQILRRRLEGLGTGAIAGALYEIGESVRTLAIDAFSESASPEGADWEPSQRALRQGGKTLVDTATLRNSLGVAMGRDEVEVGSNMVYAAIHQLGGKAGRGHKLTLPARPYLPDVGGKLLRQEVRDILREHLGEALK